MEKVTKARLKECKGTWLAQWVERATLHLEVMSWRPTLNAKITLKKKKRCKVWWGGVLWMNTCGGTLPGKGSHQCRSLWRGCGHSRGQREWTWGQREVLGRQVTSHRVWITSIVKNYCIYFPQILKIKYSRIKHVNNWQICLRNPYIWPTFPFRYWKLKSIVIFLFLFHQPKKNLFFFPSVS